MTKREMNAYSTQGNARRALDGARKAAVRGNRTDDGLVRANFTLPRDEARVRAREFLDAYPKAAYWSRVEHWRALPDGAIEFTMVRLPTAD